MQDNSRSSRLVGTGGAARAIIAALAGNGFTLVVAGRNPEMFAAVKAGITGFTRSFAQSVAPTIRVNEVAPGWIETEFAATTMTDAYRADVVDATPLRRFGTPLDVANAVLFLASDESNFVTGQTVKVNGGLSS